MDNAEEYFKKAYFAAKDVNDFEGIKEIELKVKDLSKKELDVRIFRKLLYF